jgi:hypothetical protein
VQVATAKWKSGGATLVRYVRGRLALRVGDRGVLIWRADLRWERWSRFVRDPIAGLLVVGVFFVRAQAGVPVPLEPVVWV